MASADGSHPYTCNTCQVAYRNIDLQKGHMKSDWQYGSPPPLYPYQAVIRYNLKRRVASLPPIASGVFTDKVLQARAATTAEADKALFERTCDACAKTYYSENAYRNHLLSHKHKQSLAARRLTDEETASAASSTFSLGEPTAVFRADHVGSDAEDEFNQVIESLQRTNVSQQRSSPVKRPSNPQCFAAEKEEEDNGTSPDGTATVSEPSWTLKSCLFCNYSSPTVALNISHMERFHGMFIPEKTYLVDLDGLIQHLQHQVGRDHECLTCGKIKSTVFAVQTHMRDKGHCTIPFSSEEEQLRIGVFYDFRSTYSDGDASDGEPGGAKLGCKRSTQVIIGSDGQEIEDDHGDGWETDSSVSSLDSADLTGVPAEGHYHQFERLSKHAHHSHHDASSRHQVDGWHSRAHRHTHAVFHDDYELHLPSGRSVGHRSLNRYYRQNVDRYPWPEDEPQPGRPTNDGDAGPDDRPDNERQTAVRATFDRRLLLPRGAVGMAGVSDDKRRFVRKEERRGRDAQKQRDRNNQWAYNKRANNQKTYYYRYDGGG
ncbi:hypothetical protein CP533_0262 [Ophiocordyceps camponoti-saundersi (nom. inval.)]|nr:hypothetical protein CP533_0262 [Ophiocordyceps camponoti-saundersi (nom. inval.)]